MTSDEAIGTFLYGLSLLAFDNDGLRYEDCDSADLQAIGGAALLVYRMASKSETPSDCALSRLAVYTGALLAAPRGPDGARIVTEWLGAKAEYLALQLSG